MRGVYKFFTRLTNFSFLGFLVFADLGYRNVSGSNAGSSLRRMVNLSCWCHKRQRTPRRAILTVTALVDSPDTGYGGPDKGGATK